jgi:hypothetical protein
VSAAPEFAGHDEAALVQRWLTARHGPLTTEDGRTLKVVFPGVPGGSAGPDVRGAVLDLDGDLLRGDIEMHLHARGWEEHGHAADPAYAGVVLHVVEVSDGAFTRHTSGRTIPIVVLAGELPPTPFAPGFTPPCAYAVASGLDPAPVLGRLAGRRLRQKAAGIEPLVAHGGVAQALYVLLLRTLGGPANGKVLATLAGQLPLAVLLDAARAGEGRADRLAAVLVEAATRLPLRRGGMRPAALPERRLASAARLVDRLWPPGSEAAWPAMVPVPESPRSALLAALTVDGLGRGLAVECWANAVLPAGLAGGIYRDAEAAAMLARLPSPGTYGSLRRLEAWLGPRSMGSAAALQGALLLHRDYCTRGRCGRCPLS